VGRPEAFRRPAEGSRKAAVGRPEAFRRLAGGRSRASTQGSRRPAEIRPEARRLSFCVSPLEQHTYTKRHANGDLHSESR